jgi:hypothetical protein
MTQSDSYLVRLKAYKDKKKCKPEPKQSFVKKRTVNMVKQGIFFPIITLITALAMAGTAAVFAIFGIVAIFSGMPVHAFIMGSVIETGKLVGVSWLYRNWQEATKIKYFLTPLVVLAMLLTSMGIFGLLSKAHLDQTASVGSNAITIERLESQLEREQRRIVDAETVISQLDETVQTLINFSRISGPDGARAVRSQQEEQRSELRFIIDEAQARSNELESTKFDLMREVQAIELEVGPVLYIAQLIYEDGSDRLEDAVRWVIIAFIFVFDPMSILLLMAAKYSLMQRRVIVKDGKQYVEVDEESIMNIDT